MNMQRLKYLLLGALAIAMAGCGQTVVETLNVPQSAAPDAPGQGSTIVILPFADYSYGNDVASSHRRNMKVTESLTDRLVLNGFGLPVQEDVFEYMVGHNIIDVKAYEDKSSTSLNNELTNDWSNSMKKEIRYYIGQQQTEKDNKSVASPGTHGLNKDTVAKLGRAFKADYILRGRILEYKTRQDVTWEPWRKGILPFVVTGTSQLLYGVADSANYDEWNNTISGGIWGAAIGDDGHWPYDSDEILQGSVASKNSILWGALGMGLGKMAYNSGKIDQAVVQLRVWVQDAASGEVIWTNRIRVQVAPETVYADHQYDALFDTAIDKGVTSLVDNFVTTAL
jgi:hypothetical protein